MFARIVGPPPRPAAGPGAERRSRRTPACGRACARAAWTRAPTPSRDRPDCPLRHFAHHLRDRRPDQHERPPRPDRAHLLQQRRDVGGVDFGVPSRYPRSTIRSLLVDRASHRRRAGPSGNPRDWFRGGGRSAARGTGPRRPNASSITASATREAWSGGTLAGADHRNELHVALARFRVDHRQHRHVHRVGRRQGDSAQVARCRGRTRAYRSAS